MQALNLEYLCRVVNDIAVQAAVKILEVYNSEFAIEHKEDKSPLTAADTAAHHVIVDGLTALTPNIPVLSEESASIPYATRQTWQRYWLVDPLDGTREFIKRNGEFTVNIALIESGRSILGVIVVPVTNVRYFAWRDGGTWKQQGSQAAKKIHVSKIDSSKPLRVAGSRSHGSDKMQQFIEKIGSCEMVSMGSSLKFCLVAEGKADLYPRLGLTSEWDTAAAQCVVEEAGGHVTTTDMKPLRYNTKDSLLNPEFFVFGDNSRNWQSYLP
ncbi:MAG: 3'(2'),5'-bisphosphate nucleotidase CysQ [Gammaproteobacteria bacterium]|nr:3'(2'),5'-bisphosphate nucleotidase CysQ [Gammaproteobacteria bacterium]